MWTQPQGATVLMMMMANDVTVPILTASGLSLRMLWTQWLKRGGMECRAAGWYCSGGVLCDGFLGHLYDWYDSATWTSLLVKCWKD